MTDTAATEWIRPTTLQALRAATGRRLDSGMPPDSTIPWGSLDGVVRNLVAELRGDR